MGVACDFVLTASVGTEAGAVEFVEPAAISNPAASSLPTPSLIPSNTTPFRGGDNGVMREEWGGDEEGL